MIAPAATPPSDRLADGCPVRRLGAVASTNDTALALAREGEASGTWVVAERQTAGRGTHGRDWASPPGNLYASRIERPVVATREAALASFAACLAVAETFDALAPSARVALKWPNDALLNGRKAAGVLLRAEGRGEALACLIVGIGVNLAVAPTATRPGKLPATTVIREGGRPVPPSEALEILSPALTRWLGRLRAEGFPALRDAWLARAFGLGRQVALGPEPEAMRGRFDGIDAEGRLLVTVRGRCHRLTSADLVFPD
ncbi:MAG: biotin--[acetyl-CoA-carboxylase] ligase [Paracoccaceae bacterium]